MALPPGPRGPTLYTLWRYVRQPEAFFRRGRERYGLTFSAKLAGLGNFVFLGEPAALRDVFLGDPLVLRTGEANAFVAHAVGHNSLLTLDGEALVTAGSDVRFALLGGRFVGENALLRFYVLHCVFIPVVAVTLMAVHFWRVRKDGGISGPL